MSHYVTIVMLPSDTENIENKLNEVLDPYSENIEVEPYFCDCYCVGNKAKKESREKAEIEIGSIELFRGSFRHKLNQNPNISDEEQDDLWQEHIKPLIDAEDKYLNEHPEKNKPDSNCQDCHASGKKETTYNPNSKWDWWVIGGRWTGYLNEEGYDPTVDPDNIETCFLCNGTGKRNDVVGNEERAKNPLYTCNGCNGTGKKLKWPTEWKAYKGDILPTNILHSILVRKEDKTPFALVTLDGKWHEKGNMGWWAMVSDKKNENLWRREVLKLTADYQDSISVVCDLHI